MNRLASAAGWLPIAFLVLLASPACTSVLNAGRQDNGASTGHGAGGSNGTAGGATGATTGGCQANGTECSGNDRCCSGSCDTTCRQGSGDQCLGDNDCSSLNCVNEHCACSGANPNTRGYCATDQDCCWDGGCSLAIYQGAQWGFCCRSVGETCGSAEDCCNQNCVDGECQCLAGGANCSGAFSGCCSGECENEVCKDDIGQQCTGSKDCASANCDGGVCACGISFYARSNDQEGVVAGLCSSDSDCCPDFKCATNLSIMPGATQALDGGSTCCGADGTACDQGGGGLGTTCCGDCNQGICTCEPPGSGSNCISSETCCAGGVCMPSYGNSLTCCQSNAQPCFTQDECCTGFCNSSNTCACMPAGGKCGPIATFAPLGPAACCSGACSDAGACL